MKLKEAQRSLMQGPTALENAKAFLAWNLAQISTVAERTKAARGYTQDLPRGNKGKVQTELLDMAKHICQLKDARTKQKPVSGPSLKHRLTDFILGRAKQEIEARSLQSRTWDYPDSIEDRKCNHAGCFALVVKEGRYHYSNSYGDRWRRVCWLYGYTEGQRWAVRVPNTCTSALEALEWLKPAAIKKVEDQGRWVARQGDVYLVELKSGRDNLKALHGTRHQFDKENRVLIHPQHTPVYVPARVKAIKAHSQSQLAASGGRMIAD